MVDEYSISLAAIGYTFMVFSSLIVGGLITVFCLQVITDKLLQVEKKIHAHSRIKELEKENAEMAVLIEKYQEVSFNSHDRE